MMDNQEYTNQSCSFLRLVLFVVCAASFNLGIASEVFSADFSIISDVPESRFELPIQKLVVSGADGDPFAHLSGPGGVSPNDVFSEEPALAEKKRQSALQAVGLSLLLPGAGQLYADRPGQARLFLGVEAGVWLSYVGFSLYGDWRERDYIHFAQSHAGIDPSGKDDSFYSNISVFADRNQYVTFGRALEPDDPFYPDTPEWQWNWDSSESRDQFRDLFNDQRSANRNAEFMVVAAGVNRLVSAVMAWRAVKKNNKEISNELSTDLEFSNYPESSQSALRNTLRLAPLKPSRDVEGMMLRFSHSF